MTLIGSMCDALRSSGTFTSDLLLVWALLPRFLVPVNVMEPSPPISADLQAVLPAKPYRAWKVGSVCVLLVLLYLILFVTGLKLIEKSADGGRKLTQQGRRDIDRIAGQIKAKERKALRAGVLTL